MKRKDFLRSLGIAGVGLALPTSSFTAKANENAGDCVLIPSETAGPFPWDLTENSFFFRQNVAESEAGVPLHLRMRIIGDGNCEPMPNVRVHIWHCNKDGAYSAYDVSMNPGQAGKTYCRGWQMTDANGEVEFTTIFPGWYPGRICHIHFQVYVSSVYAAISQLTFDLSAKNALYSANQSIYTKGVDPLTFTSDNIFSDGYTYQLATLTPSESGNGYDSFMEVTVKGNGISGLQNAEPETGGQFALGQNYPNPCVGTTHIPFRLHQSGFVSLQLFDLSGKKVADIINQELHTGEYNIPVDVSELGLPIQNYAYQLRINNGNGTFNQSKLLSVQVK